MFYIMFSLEGQMKKIYIVLVIFCFSALLIGCDKEETTTTTVSTTSYRTFEFQDSSLFPSMFDRNSLTNENETVESMADCRLMLSSMITKLLTYPEFQISNPLGYEGEIADLMIDGKLYKDDFYSLDNFEIQMKNTSWYVYAELNQLAFLLDDEYYDNFTEDQIYDNQDSLYQYFYFNEDSFYFYRVTTDYSEDNLNMYHFEFLEDGSYVYETYFESNDTNREKFGYFNYSSKNGYIQYSSSITNGYLNLLHINFDYTMKTFDRLVITNYLTSYIITRELTSYADGYKLTESKGTFGHSYSVSFYDDNNSFIFSNKVTTPEGALSESVNTFSLLYLGNWDYFTNESVFKDDVALTSVTSGLERYVIEVNAPLTESLFNAPIEGLTFSGIEYSSINPRIENALTLLDNYSVDNHIITLFGVSYTNDGSGVIDTVEFHTNH